MNATMPPPTAGNARLGTGFPVPEVALERTPTRRIHQRRDRATAQFRPGNLGARGSLADHLCELFALEVLAGCSLAAVLLAFW